MDINEGGNLRQAVFGANDGLVSTFGLVAGLIGAAVTQNVLIIASVVSMFAAAMSMGLGSYLATKSELEYNRRIKADERKKIIHHPSHAEAELLLLLKQQGIPANKLRSHVKEITRSADGWLDFVLWEKHGLGRASFPNPIKGGAIMFVVFVLCGFIPIVPLFFAQSMHALIASAIVTAIALFAVGAMKASSTGKIWWKLGIENLLIGAITGIVGFIAGVYTAGLLS